MAEKTFDLSILFKLVDKASAPLRRAINTIDSLGKKADVVGSKIRSMGKGMRETGEAIALRLTAPLLLLGKKLTSVALDFESAFTGVRKTVNATEKEFQALEAGFKKLSTEIPVSTTALYGIGEAAGQLGIEAKNILSFSKVMADLGATTNLQGEDAAKALARFANITSMSQGDFDRLGSVIVDLGNNLATTESEIVNMAMRLAGAGSTVGLTEAQIMSFAGALSSVGIQAEAGGTAFSRVMKDISREVESGGEKVEAFATIAGKSSGDFVKQWKSNAAFALLDFIEGLKKFEEKGVSSIRILDALGFEGIRVSDSLLRASGAGDKFRAAMDRGNTAWKNNNALTREANLRYKTAASRLTIFKNKVTLLAEEFGRALIPRVLDVAKKLEPLINTMKGWDADTKGLVASIGLLTVGLAAIIIPLGMIITAVGTVAGAFVKLWAGIKIVGGILAVLGGAISAPMLIGLAALAALIVAVTTWGTITEFWSGVISSAWEKIVAIFTKAWEIIGKVVDAMKIAGSSIMSIPSKIISQVFKQDGKSMNENISSSSSKTDVNIKVSSDQGSIATVEKVRSKGDSKVNVMNDSYLGAGMGVGN